jgi:hypothetical protein
VVCVYNIDEYGDRNDNGHDGLNVYAKRAVQSNHKNIHIAYYTFLLAQLSWQLVHPNAILKGLYWLP